MVLLILLSLGCSPFIIAQTCTLTNVSQSAEVCEGAAGASATINLTGLEASATLTIDYTIGGTPYSVSVTAASDGTASFLTPLLTYAGNNGNVLEITNVSQPGCSQDYTGTGKTVTLIVNEYLTPTVQITKNLTYICSGTSVTFTATASNAGTPSNYVWKIDGGGVGGNTNTYATSSLAPGSHTVEVEITSSETCTSSPTATHQLNFTVENLPNPPADGPNENCGPGAVSLTATGGSNETIDWYASSTGGSVLAGGSGTGSYTTPVISGTTTYYAQARNTITGCISATRTAVVATINPVPPTLAASQTIVPRCGAGSVTLSPTVPGGTEVDWYDAATGGNFITTANSYSPNVALGTTKFYAEARIGDCVAPNRLEFTVTANTIPSDPAVTANSRCGTGTVGLSATGAATLRWYDVASGGSILGTGTNFTTPSISGTTNYWVESYNTTTGCVSNRVQVIATVNPLPATPTAGTAAAGICASGTTTLNAVVPGGYTIDWYSGNSGGTVLTGGTGTSSFNTPNISGTTTYYAEARDNTTGCVSGARLAVVATVNANPSAPSGSAAGTACGPNGTTSLSATGAGANETYEWFTTSTGGTAFATGTPVTSPQVNANTTVYVEKKNTVTGCVSPRTSVSIIWAAYVVPTVTVSASSTDICTGSGGTAVLFTANVTNAGASPSYQWQTGSGASWSNYGSPTTSSTLNISQLSSGTGVRVILTSNATCANPNPVTSSPVTMTTYSTSAPSFAGSDKMRNVPSSICPPATFSTNVDPASGSPTSYIWSLPANWAVTGGDGTGSVTITVSGGAAAGNNLNYSVVAKNACGTSGSIGSGNVKVGSSLGVYAGSDQTICQNSAVNLSATKSGLTSRVSWKSSPASGSFTNINTTNGSATFTPSTTGSYYLIATTDTATGACSNNSNNAIDTFLLIVRPTPSATWGTAQTICESNTATLTINNPNALAETVSYSVGGVAQTPVTVPANGSTNITTGILSATTTATITQVVYSTSPSCTVTPNSSTTITVNPKVVISAGSPQTVCSNGTITLNGSVSGGATTATWSAPTGSFANASVLNTVYTPGKQSGTETLTLTSASPTSPCTVQTSTVLITINQAPTIDIGNVTTPLCQGTNFNLVSTTGGSTSSVTWTTNGGAGGSFTNASAANTSYTAPTSLFGSIRFIITTNDPDGAGPCTVAADTLEAYINQAATATAGSDATICSDGTVALNGTIGGSATGITWTATSGSFDNANSLTAVYTPSLNSGTATLTMTTNDPDAGEPCAAAISTLLVTIQSKPVINNVGANYTVCESANPSPLTLGGVSLGGGATTGAWSITQGSGTLSNTSQTNNPSSVTFTPAANFSGVVKLMLTTNTSSACTTAATAERTITINAAPTIDAGADQTICSDATVNLNAAIGNATGGTWSTNGNGAFSNANSAATTYTPSTDDINTGSVVLTFQTSGQTAPCTSVSDQLTVFINKKPTITSQPQNKIICAGNAVSLSVNATGTNLTYQWYKGTAPGGTPVGTNSATLSFSQAQPTDEGNYYVIISGTSPCTSATSNAVTLVVNEQINITSQPAGGTICQDDNITLTVQANAGADPISFQWYKGTPGSGVAVTNGGNISGAATNALTFTSADPVDNGSYYAVISGPAGYSCGTVNSLAATVTVNPTPDVVANPTSQSICSATATSIGLSGSVTGTTFAWTAAASGVTGASNVSGSANPSTISQTLTTSSQVQGSVTYTITPTAAGCSGTPVNVTITVNPQPNITITPSAAAICSGSPYSIALVSDVANTDFTWTVSGSGVSGASGGTYTGTNGSISPTLTASGYAPGTVTYHIVNNTPGGCFASPTDVTVTVNPIPDMTVTNSKPSLCSFAATNIGLTSNVSGTTFAWTATSSTGTITGFGTGNGASIIQQLENSGTAAGIVTYSITPTFAGCSGTIVDALVTVNPLPTGSISAGINGTATVCLNSSANIGFTGNNGTSPYTFFYTVTGKTGNDSIGPAASTASVTGRTDSSGNIIYTLYGVKDANSTEASCPQALPDPKPTATLTVRPPLTATIATNAATACVGSTSPTVTLTGGNGTGTSYTFTYTINGGTSQTVSGNPATISVPTGSVGNYTYAITNVQEVGSLGCGNAITGQSTSIAVQTTQSVTLTAGSANTSICVSNAIGTNIQYTVGGSATGASVTGLPSGMSSSFSGGVLTITGTPTVAGTFNYTVTTSGPGPCTPTTAPGTITVYPAATGGTAINNSNLLLCSTANGGSISLSGQDGTIANWQSSTNGGQTWSNIASTTNPLTFTNIGQTTYYRAVVQKAGCSSTQNAYSAYATASVVVPNGVGSLTFSTNPTPAIICSGSVTLTANGFGSDSTTGNLYGGDFDNAGVYLDGPGKWRKTLISNFDSQDKINVEASTNNTNNSAFNLTNGPKTFFDVDNPCPDVTYNNNPLGGQVNNTKFMATIGPNTSSLESPIFNLVGLQTASFDWWQAYILQSGASIKAEISFDGGLTYTTTLATWTGPATYGSPTNFATQSLNLNPYVGLSNLRIRFTYVGTSCSSWGLEKATITKGYVPADYTWSLYNPIPAGGTASQHYLSQFVNQTVVSTPPANTSDTAQTYSYSISSSAGGCGANITVTVLPVLKTTVSNPNTTVCSGAGMSAITFGANVAGTAFSWTRATNTNVTFTPNTASGTGGSIPSATSIVNNTSSPQTITYNITPSNANACSPTPMQTSFVVNPNLAVVLSGNQTFCGTGLQQVKLKSNGPFPITVTLSNGQSVTLNSAADSIVTLAPALTATGTVTISSMTNTSCNATPISGTATVSFSAGANLPIGHWGGGNGGCTTSGPTSSGRDWFNPCNWGGGVIPTNSIDVFIIESESVCDPIIDPTTSWAAINGPVAKTRNITISGNTRNLSFANGGQLDVAGNWTNNIGPAGFTANTGTVVFMGNSTNTPGPCNSQTVQTTSGNVETFYNLVINNTCAKDGTGDNVILNSPVNVNGVFTLIDGIVKTTSTNILTIVNDAVGAVVGGGTITYVNGPMVRNTIAGNTYDFPVGKPNSPYGPYRPARVTPTSGIYYTAEYFNTTAPETLDNRLGDLMGQLNTEYWDVQPTNSCTGEAIIGLPYYYPNNSGHWTSTGPCSSCNVAIVKPAPAGSHYWAFTDYPNLNSGFDLGIPETRPYDETGWIYSKSIDCASFADHHFTFGYASSIILPVKLLTFNGKLVNENAELTWTITDHADLAGFELEYSRDARNFNKLTNVAPNGTDKFNYTHRNLQPGVHYYRLLMKDKTGRGTYSKTVMLVVGRDITIIKGMKATVVLGTGYVEIWSASSQKARVQIFDMTGRLLDQQTGHILQGENSMPVRMLMLPQGVYNLLVTTDDGVKRNLRLMKE